MEGTDCKQYQHNAKYSPYASAHFFATDNELGDNYEVSLVFSKWWYIQQYHEMSLQLRLHTESSCSYCLETSILVEVLQRT